MAHHRSPGAWHPAERETHCAVTLYAVMALPYRETPPRQTRHHELSAPQFTRGLAFDRKRHERGIRLCIIDTNHGAIDVSRLRQ
jgi:hypothetical protein